MRNYSSLHEFFQSIEKLNYVVLRNFEDIEAEISLGRHPDIDILCDTPDALIKITEARPRTKLPDRTHLQILVNGSVIPVDLRVPGDNYLDRNWEEQILATKAAYYDMYVPSEENLYYSLLYHVCIQKNTIKEDYYKKLSRFRDSGDVPGSRSEMLQQLETFLRSKGYKYVYPANALGIFHTAGCCRDLILPDYPRMLLRFLMRPVACLLKLKKK